MQLFFFVVFLLSLAGIFISASTGGETLWLVLDSISAIVSGAMTCIIAYTRRY